MYRAAVVVLSLVGCSACASGLLSRRDYQASLHEYYRGRPEAALAALPAGESGGFVTDLETGYLSLLSGEPNLAPLEEQAARIEDRLRFDVSRELQSFFYVETRDGYYASEHEIIWLHLLLSWGYSKRGEPELGCVEAKRASDLLTMPWSSGGHFDDPLLRIILAGMWTLCGDWAEAQIDFGRAAELDAGLTWARALADREVPPRHLTLVFGGVGPAPVWDPDLALNVVRGYRDVELRQQGQKSALALVDSAGRELPTHRTPDSSAWYARHRARDNALHNLIGDSRYGTQAVAVRSVQAGEVTLALAIAITAGTAILGLGGGLILLAAYAESGELFGLGLVVAIAGPVFGWNLGSRAVESSERRADRRLDPAESYRYVRFLPEYVWVAASDDDLQYPLQVAGAPAGGQAIRPLGRGSPQLAIGFLPDVDEAILDPNVWLPPERAWARWRDAFAGDLHRLAGADNLDALFAGASANPEADDVELKTPRGYTVTLELTEGHIRMLLKTGMFDRDHSIDIAQTEGAFTATPIKGLLFLDEDPTKVAELLWRALAQRPVP